MQRGSLGTVAHPPELVARGCAELRRRVHKRLAGEEPRHRHAAAELHVEEAKRRLDRPELFAHSLNHASVASAWVAGCATLQKRRYLAGSAATRPRSHG